MTSARTFMWNRGDKVLSREDSRKTRRMGEDGRTLLRGSQ
jgi:hypothetical protein